MNTVDRFTDVDQCIDFVTELSHQKVCMIISCEISLTTVPLIHDICQLHTILIFCENKTEHQHWSKIWSKVQGIFAEISLMCQTLQQIEQQYEHNFISISFVPTTDDLPTKRLDQLEPSFMYSQIMKEILLTIEFEDKDFEEFIAYCREMLADNASQLQNLDKLKRRYRQETPIWWYTHESLLYPTLNRALRTLDTDLITTLGFFIKDLHLQIKQLYHEQFDSHNSNESFFVYRGQGMAKEEFEKMMQTKDGLLSFNCFLSTSKVRDVPFLFAESVTANPNLIGILFVMTIDPSQSTTPFAAIGDVGYYKNQEEEVLFSMHTIFRIKNITSMNKKHGLYQADLTLTQDNDPELRALTDRIREETSPDSYGWDRLGAVLLAMGRSQKAEKIFQTSFKKIRSKEEKAPIYHNLGVTKNAQGDYKQAIVYYEKALAIQQQSLSPNHPDLAFSYNNIGNVYKTTGEYSRALSSFEKALGIQQQSLPPNHPDLAFSYNNIGNLYETVSEYLKALLSHENALAIRQQSLSPNHPDLASCYNNIGSVHHHMGEYSKSILSFEKAFAIQQQSLPPNHPDLASSYNNIGSVYQITGEYSKALSSFEKALAIRQQSLPPNHPHLADSYNNIGSSYNKMGEYMKALSSHENAFAIRQQSLSPNHPDLAGSYNNIGNVHFHMGEYSKALSSHEKALAIRQQSLPPNHPDLADSYHNIGIVYKNMGEYSKALSSHEKALAIQQQSLPPNHPDLASSYNNIGLVYSNMGEYSKALSSHEKALAMRQQSLPPNHLDLASSYNNIGSVYSDMGEYSKALSSFEKALAIQQQSLPPNHPDLASSYGNLGLLYEKMGNLSKAHSFFERSLKIAQHSIPWNHPILKRHQNDLDRIKKKI